HGEQGRHLRARGARSASRAPVLRRGADLDDRSPDAERRRDRDRGARVRGGDVALAGPQPGLRRHARGARDRDRDRGRRPPSALQRVAAAADAGDSMRALVLAAGYATRLYPLTLDTPKHLLEIGGRPMVDWVIDRLEP